MWIDTSRPIFEWRTTKGLQSEESVSWSMFETLCLQTAMQDRHLSITTFEFIRNNPYVELYNDYSCKSVIHRPKTVFITSTTEELAVLGVTASYPRKCLS